MPLIFDSLTTNRLYKKLSLSVPEAKTELIYNNHFELLIAVMLTAQTTDKIVNEITPSLFKKYPDPKSFILCGEEKLAHLIKRIGLAPTKAKKHYSHMSIIVKSSSWSYPKN